MRVIALIDLDCFFVGVEVLENPALAGKPVAVCQYTKSETVIALSYEAKAKGVKRGMFGSEARKVCPEIQLVQVQTKNEKADLTKYRRASTEVLEIARRFCSTIERASVDEFYLDLSLEAQQEQERHPPVRYPPDSLLCTGHNQVVSAENHDFAAEDGLLAAASTIVSKIRQAVKQELTLDCSAGIAKNKFLAKSIAGIRKPATQILLPAQYVSMLCQTMPIEKAKSLGGKMGVVLKEKFGVSHLGDLDAMIGAPKLADMCGAKEARRLIALSRGDDSTPVESRMLAKSIGCSKTFPGKQCLTSRDMVSKWTRKLCSELIERLEEDGRRPTTISVGVYHFGSRSSSNLPAILSHDSLCRTCDSLFDRLLSDAQIQKIGGITSMGVNLSGFPEDAPRVNTKNRAASWTCRLCTFENDGVFLRCELCSADKGGNVSLKRAQHLDQFFDSKRSRPAGEEEEAATGHSWVCKVCTFAGNDFRFLRCEMCDTLR